MGEGITAALVCPRGRDHQLEAILGVRERAFCHECMEDVGLVADQHEPRPSRMRSRVDREPFIRKLQERHQILRWVIDGKDQDVDGAGEFLRAMPDPEFVHVLRACGLDAAALQFEYCDGMDRLAALCGSSAGAMAELTLAAVNATSPIRTMVGMLSLLDALEAPRDPTWQWLHHQERRVRARAKYGQGRPRWINGRMRAKTREERRKRRGAGAR